jgi:Family of unknown function (DUF5760)
MSECVKPVANPKIELIQNIKEWVKLDTEIKKLKAEVRQREKKKKTLTSSLVNVMKKSNVDCFDITGGSIEYKQTKQKKPLTSKTLLSALETYYKEDTDLAKELTKYILDSRQVEIKETIVMKINNPPPERKDE